MRPGSGLGAPPGRALRFRLLAGATVLMLTWGATPWFSGAGWIPGLLADTVAQGALVAGVGAAVLLARRRTRAAGAVWVGLGVLCLLGVVGSPRARHGPATPAAVRLAVFNANPRRTDPDAGIQAIRAFGADVTVLTEAPARLARALGADAELPGVLLRRPERGDRPWQAAVSRWPLVLLESPARADALCFRVERPGAPFVVVGIQPPSPRSAADWADGNRRVEAAAALAQQMAASGESVVIAADLNSTPAGHRSRILARGGFLRAKPRTVLAGTYPAGWPWPLSVAIDDVFVPEGVVVQGWRTAPGAGSDHRAVVVEISIPVGAGGAGP